MPTLTVYFDDPWWVGVLEVTDGGVLRAARYVFGAEPSNDEVLALILANRIDPASMPAIGAADGPEAPRPRNPKRAAREAARRTREHGVSTKTQEALRLALEAGKRERRRQSRDERERLAEERRAKARAKARARHRGR